jgi:hypothetical protein
MDTRTVARGFSILATLFLALAVLQAREISTQETGDTPPRLEARFDLSTPDGGPFPSDTFNPDSIAPAEFYAIAFRGGMTTVPVSEPVCVGPPIYADQCTGDACGCHLQSRGHRSQGVFVSFLQARVG